MPDFHHILFPADFSERSRAVRPFVKAAAQQFGAKVTLLHVIDLPKGIYTGMDAAYPISLDEEAMRRDAEALLAAFWESKEGPSILKENATAATALLALVRLPLLQHGSAGV